MEMGKRVILTLLPGNFEQGFGVDLRIKEDDASAESGIQGQLPSASNLPKLFKQWQSEYEEIVTPHFRIKPSPAQVTNISYRQLGSQLAKGLNDWLNSECREWQKIRDRLQQKLSETDEILVIIKTDDALLRQLPWHLWDLFSKHYTKSEIALGMPEYESIRPITIPRTNKVRILAILGNSTGINVKKDRDLLKQLPDTEVIFLEEPQRQKLNNQLWEQPWDILFFAGHSFSQVDGSTGQIYINKTDSLSLLELKSALRKAIKRGLQIAIFNSCQGLGLARELADLHIPQVIVMREPVPDLVAQDFLKHFLKAFVQDKPLHLAVREARERLEGLESRFPCASWLPVICQNSSEVPLTWAKLRFGVNSDIPTDRVLWRSLQTLTSRYNFSAAFILSLIVTFLVIGVRQTGMLQIFELQAFDQLIRQRPAEKPDPRLLLVTITDTDIQNRKESELSDRTLAQLLEKLESHEPRIIGLDIFRDFSIGTGYADLAPHLLSPRLIAVCGVSDRNKVGISPPPEISVERLGFSNVLVDNDGILRRQLLSIDPSPTDSCSTTYAFSLQLALQYLAADNILPKPSQEYLQLNNTVFKPLKIRMGGYQQLDDRGHQLLLNYRSRKHIANQVTLTDLLEGKVNPDWIKDRIVMIGYSAASKKDAFYTPFTTKHQQNEQMPGVIVHAQMTSQILSAVLDGRPLLWVWSAWGEIVWIWGWAFVGGAIAWGGRLPLLRLVVAVATLSTLHLLCFGLLIQGGWVPLVPSAFALVIAGGSVMLVYRKLQT